MIAATWHSGESMHPAASRNGHHRFHYKANLAGRQEPPGFAGWTIPSMCQDSQA